MPGGLNGSAHHADETELHKLIRYGCDFELELHQEQELEALRQENAVLRKQVRKQRKDARRRARRRKRRP